jgi:endoglucanase
MSLKFFTRVIASLLIISGLSLAGYALYRSSAKADETQVFAERTLLSGLHDSYLDEYWEDETGRTLDKQRNDITTSEGQSYTMLRAVWVSDKPTFDKTWKWTQEHIQREDKLFSWQWGKKPDGSYGVLTDQGGQNAASDGDTDIALALLMAASRWQDRAYLADAQEIIPAIWEHEVVAINGRPYLAANDLEKQSSQATIMNPSYLAPYAYRHFAKADKKNDWNGLVGSSYELINQSMDAALDKGASVGLVPDWISMDRNTGQIMAVASAPNELTTNYSYDAMRTAWRLAVDHQWNNEPRAKQTLQKMRFLSDEWRQHEKIISTYSHDGKRLSTDEPPEAYGTSIGYFAIVSPELADEVYAKKMKSLYDANDNTWTQPMNYYSDNWTWFGIALYNDQLPDLAKEL